MFHENGNIHFEDYHVCTIELLSLIWDAEDV